MKVLGILIAAVPFAFAAIRLFATGNDMRYLWIAVVSTLCAIGLLVVLNRLTRPGILRLGVGTIAVAAFVAATGIILGARAVSGIALVAISFSLCSTLGIAVVLRSRAKDSE
jgi:heme exporter protein D